MKKMPEIQTSGRSKTASHGKTKPTKYNKKTNDDFGKVKIGKAHSKDDLQAPKGLKD